MTNSEGRDDINADVIDKIINNVLDSIKAQVAENVLDKKEQLLVYAVILTNLAGYFIDFMESKFEIAPNNTIKDMRNAYKYLKEHKDTDSE